MKRFFTLSAVVLLWIGGCDLGGQQDDFADDAAQAPQGYTQTDEGGEVIGTEDKDDWRTAPVYRGAVYVYPAYPNPVTSAFVSVPVTVVVSNTVRGGLVLRGHNSSGGLVTLASVPEARDPGTYAFTFSTGILGRRGLVRVYLFDSGSEIVSYGDLLIQ